MISPIRIRNSRVELPEMNPSNISNKARERDVSNVNETSTSNYQELREFTKAGTYDTIQHNWNCN